MGVLSLSSPGQLSSEAQAGGQPPACGGSAGGPRVGSDPTGQCLYGGGGGVLAFEVVAPAARQMLTEATPAEPALPPPASQWEEFRQPADPPKP